MMANTHWDDLREPFSQRGWLNREVHRLKWGARERQIFFSDQTRTPRLTPKGRRNQVIQLSFSLNMDFFNVAKCRLLQHGKNQWLRNCMLNKVTSMNPKNTPNISCAISFWASEAALNKKEKQKPWNVSEANQKIHKSQYCFCAQQNTKKQNAKLGPASPGEQMACNQHPIIPFHSAAGMHFEASSSGIGFGATISTWPSLSNFLGLLPCTKPVKTPTQLFKYLTSELLDVIHSSQAHSNQISGQVLL